jgi:hypothetical protein
MHLFFWSTVLVNIWIKRKWLWFWYGTILVWQIGGIPADDDTISAKSIQIRWNHVLCTCQVPGDVCNIPCQHAPTLWAMTFILWHLVFAATIAVNMCISSYSINSCVPRIFVYALQDIILLTILLYLLHSLQHNVFCITYSCESHLYYLLYTRGGWIVNHGLNHHHQWPWLLVHAHTAPKQLCCMVNYTEIYAKGDIEHFKSASLRNKNI